MQWVALWLLILLFILLPFFLFEEDFEQLPGLISASRMSAWLTGLAIAGLLAMDIFLPVPSSLLSTAAGALLGFWLGAAVCWAGMTAGCLLGYALGDKAGRGVSGRLVEAGELERVSKTTARFGDWMIIVLRAVPVLAEASVFFAGMTRLPFRRFLLLAASSNLGISLAYSAVGAWSVRVESFLLAFFGAILLPAAAMGVAKAVERNP